MGVQTRVTWIVVAMSWVTGCSGPEEGEPGESPDAQAPPVVEIFGPGTVSSELAEFAIAFDRTGDTVFFNRMPPDDSPFPLYFAVREPAGWSSARPFPPTEGISAIDPFMSLDGSRLYVSSDGPPGARSETFGLWYVERTAAGWSDLRDVGAPVNSDSSDTFNSITADGTMYFSSRRGGPRQIYRTRRVGDGWTPPELVRFGTVDEATNPAVSPDGSFIVLSIVGDSTLPDLFVSCRAGNGWSEPQRLPEPINSPFREFTPTVAPPHLYFTSERPGIVPAQPDSVRPPGDLYRTSLAPVRRRCAAEE